jgi:hypothetical protein
MAAVADKESVEFARECVRLDVPDEGFGVAAVRLKQVILIRFAPRFTALGTKPARREWPPKVDGSKPRRAAPCFTIAATFRGAGRRSMTRMGISDPPGRWRVTCPRIVGANSEWSFHTSSKRSPENLIISIKLVIASAATHSQPASILGGRLIGVPMRKAARIVAATLTVFAWPAGGGPSDPAAP